MSKILKSLLIMMAALLLTAGAASAANSLAVVGACASEGSFGMRVTHDGSTNIVYVQDDTPADESVYRMSFDFDVDTMSVPHQGKYIIGVGLREGVGTRPFQLLISRNNVNGWKAWCQFAKNNDILAATGKVDVDPAQFNTLQIEWVQSQGGGIDDGVCRITNLTNAQTQAVTDIRNSLLAVGRVRMGITGRASIPTGGQHCYDDFQSFRTLAP